VYWVERVDADFAARLFFNALAWLLILPLLSAQG